MPGTDNNFGEKTDFGLDHCYLLILDSSPFLGETEFSKNTAPRNNDKTSNIFTWGHEKKCLDSIF